MDSNINAEIVNPTSRRFVKLNIPNLIKLEPIGTYYGRCKVHGKLVCETFDTKNFKVSKTKVRQRLIWP